MPADPTPRALRLAREPLTTLELTRVAAGDVATTTQGVCVSVSQGRCPTLEDPRCVQSLYSPDCTKTG